MSAELINLIVLIGAVAIVAAFALIVYKAATRRGGGKLDASAKAGRQRRRKVNPKTGDLFP